MITNIFGVITEMELRLPVYVTSAGGWHNQMLMNREQGFPDYQWIQSLGGSGKLSINGKTYTVHKGQGMLLFPHEVHEYEPITTPWSVRWVSFNGACMASLLDSMHFNASTVLYLTNPDTTLGLMHSILTALQSQNPLRSMECSTLAYELLLDLFLHASSSEVRSKQQHMEQLTPVFTLIENSYNETITLQQIADKLGVTPQHACLLFQQTLGIRPIAYLNRYRLRKAKELLLQELELEVREVAGRVGYSDCSYFIKLFKRQEGITPSSFRKNHRLL
ncbi:AraC family transcriptional regulator [Paenibacillus agricola]|uniref:AraC family transcriptional regulator n=1 Tax=Paenibacillus agricola TaxID=2716264 RepID=A0ABX0J767_9BACL|nr:AraC family transcriptional regulator [Paenibacillus agricola]NHN31982.1 AraC family transcriptional regulator [Paenibacillus agricola]